MRNIIKRLFIIFLACTSLVSCVTLIDVSNFTSKANYLDNDLILINNAKDLLLIGMSENKDKDFVLTQDIYLQSDHSWQSLILEWNGNWHPINSQNNTGSFDGGGHKIIGINTQSGDDVAGLFSINSLDIKNLFLEANIKNTSTNTNSSAGALCGVNYGKIDNVHANGSIVSSVKAGGLIGNNFGNIDNCSFKGIVQSRTVGGLIGTSNCESITNSYVIGEIQGHIAGGFIGELISSLNSAISNSYSNCKMIKKVYDETVSRIGGFIAIRESGNAIKYCYSNDNTLQIAVGSVDGIIALSTQDLQQSENYGNFDMINHWFYNSTERSMQLKTISVSSNTIIMSGVEVFVGGNKKYYIQDDDAIIKIFSGNKKNIGIAAIIIDGEDETNNLEDNQYFFKIKKHTNVKFDCQYLIKVEINQSKNAKIALNNQSGYYCPGDDIVVTDIGREKNVTTVYATYKGKRIDFASVENNSYSAKVPENVFIDNEILYIDLQVTVLSWWAILIICLSAAIIVATGIIVFFKVKRNRKSKTTTKE